MDIKYNEWLLIGVLKLLLLTASCSASDLAGDPPRIVGHQDTVTVVKDATVVLYCEVANQGNLEVKWYAGSNLVNTDDPRFNVDNDGQMWFLTIANVSPEDQMTYACQLGTDGNVRESTQLIVKEKERDYAAVQEQDIVTIRVVEGTDAILPCNSVHGTDIEVVWLSGEKVITKNGRILIGDTRIRTGPDNALRIIAVTPGDSATYKCVTKDNSIDIDSPSISFVVSLQVIQLCSEDAAMYCLNGGTCYILSVFNTKVCDCPQYYSGVRCEQFTLPSSEPMVEIDWSYNSVRLPLDIRPSLYNISFRPLIYDGENNFEYTCVTKIYLTCQKSTHFIRLHSLDHEINSIILFENQEEPSDPPSHLNVQSMLEEKHQMLHLWVEEGLQAGHEYILEIKSRSSILPSLRGFYYNTYMDEGKKKYIFTTMMEPTDARRVFPCFDEPDFKSIFIFTVDRKQGLRTLTNLPLRTTVGPDDEGFYTDVFDQPRNVPMSTYLVAIAIGDLDYLETYVGETQFRTWSRSNAVHATEYALKIGAKIMAFFKDYFKVKYPLPKEDMIAVPLMSFSAMEHWGLITYAEDSMLFEDGITNEVSREWIAVIVAHELSHQWFGNLVSPRWWDDLWLNEGFATYMMFTAVKHVLPEWKIDDKIVVDYRGVQNVFKVDSSLTSHPVYIPVEHPDEISQIFDLISYAKGSALIRMMNNFLGEETFTKGLTRYLTEFSYKTATHNDLWYSLGNQSLSDKNSINDVKSIMDTWLLEANYPLVTMTRQDDGTVRVSQTPFLMTQKERDARAPVCWNIPLWYTTKEDPNFDKIDPSEITWLPDDCTEVILDNIEVLASAWIIGNTQQLGYFRVNYDIYNWLAIFEQLNRNHLVIDPINRAQIISDSFNLARAGMIEFNVAMMSLEYIDKEMDFVPWKAALTELDFIRRCLHISPAYGKFQRFMKEKISNPFFATFETEHTHYNTIRYATIAAEACRYGVRACTDEASREFKEWMKNPAIVKLDPNLKGLVYCVGVAEGGEEAVQFIFEAYTRATSAQEKTYLLDALSCTQIPWLLGSLLKRAIFTEDFSITDRLYMVEKIALTPVGRLIAWPFLMENWDHIFDAYGDGLNLFSSLVKTVTRPFNTQSELRSLERFISEKDNLGTGQRAFEMAVEQTRANIEITAKLESYFAD